MPLGPGVRYRWKNLQFREKGKTGFRGNKVIEVKPKGGTAEMVAGAIGKAKPKKY